MGTTTKTSKNSSTKLQEIIMAKTMESLNPNATEEKPKAKKNAKKVETSKETPKKVNTKEKNKKEAKKTSEKKEIKREVKYVYPEDCTDALSKKKFRAKARAELRKANKDLDSVDPKSKDYKKFTSNLKEVQAKYLRA